MRVQECVPKNYYVKLCNGKPGSSDNNLCRVGKKIKREEQKTKTITYKHNVICNLNNFFNKLV